KSTVGGEREPRVGGARSSPAGDLRDAGDDDRGPRLAAVEAHPALEPARGTVVPAVLLPDAHDVVVVTRVHRHVRLNLAVGIIEPVLTRHVVGRDVREQIGRGDGNRGATRQRPDLQGFYAEGAARTAIAAGAAGRGTEPVAGHDTFRVRLVRLGSPASMASWV